MSSRTAVTALAAIALIWAQDASHAQNASPPGPGRGPNPMPGLVGLVESPTSGPGAPRFEVASVKRNLAGRNGAGGMRTSPDGQVRATNVTLQMLVRSAYGLRLTDQVVGGPSWIDSYAFDVDAKPSGAVALDQSRYMLRTLLADRFKLVVRRESREQPVYALVRARRDGTIGPQMKRPAGECVMVVPGFARAAGRGNASAPDPATLKPSAAPGQPGRRCGVGPDGDTMRAGSATMTTLVTFLTPLLDRPVVDRTGLIGAFDFDLRYEGAGRGLPLGRGRATAVSPDAPAEPGAGPSLFTALQEQLGLKLESQRGSVDVLAVQSAELPSEN